MRRRSSLARSIELGIAAPAVIAMRTARMIAAGSSPNRSDRREMTRMATEKVLAFGEAWLAMAMRQQRAQVEWSLALWRAWFAPLTLAGRWMSMAGAASLSRQVARSQADVLVRGMAPLHRVATANARRLSRRRR